LTASDSTQFAWEGDKVIGETDNSLFTHYLIEGLEGKADADGDGRITVDELYDYAYEQVKLATPKQTPSKFSTKQQGEIVLRQSMPLEEIRSVPLPQALLDSIENPFSDIRLGAVQQLTKLLNGKNLGLARSAREALEKIAETDDSRQVSRAAVQALESAQGDVQSIARKEVTKVHAPLQQEVKPLSFESLQTTFSSRQLALITVGWAIAGLIGGVVYDSVGGEFGGGFAGAIGGAIGGFITAAVLQLGNHGFNWKKISWFTLAWAIGIGVGWSLGEWITETIGAAIGYAIGAGISVVIMLGFDYVFSNLVSVAWIILAWAAGGGLGWAIAKKLMIESMSMDYMTSWAVGTASGWAIAGFVMGWQLLKDKSKQG
jgi:hypothetical protein